MFQGEKCASSVKRENDWKSARGCANQGKKLPVTTAQNVFVPKDFSIERNYFEKVLKLNCPHKSDDWRD